MEYLVKLGKMICKNKRLLVIFIFSFLVYEFFAFSNNNNDPIAMYAFSHAIKMGEIPYRDFNIISTPLYAFLMTLGLYVFDNYLMFIIEQSLLVTILFYFLFKMFDKKAWLILLAMTLSRFFGFLPTYNFLCFLFMVILVYLEKEYSNKDYLIGLILGLAILSKHTVGFFLVVATIIIYFKDIKKIMKRLLGFMIPCFLFLIYLWLNRALYDFMNLTVLGLFDFAGNNSQFAGRYFWFALLLLFIMTFVLFKNHNHKYHYYFICGFFFCIPLFDLNHFALFFNCFSIFLLDYLRFSKINFVVRLSIFLVLLYGILYFICTSSCGVSFYTKFEHFNYMYNFKKDYDYSIKINQFLDTYKDDNVIILSGYTMFYDILRDREINYYDVLLYGNHGYHGTQTMIDKIKKEKDVYIIVDYIYYEISNKRSQYNKDIVHFVVENYEKIDSKFNFDVYYKA